MNRTFIESIYRHHYRYFFMVAYNLCRRGDMAEDIVQEGFIKLITSKEQFLDMGHARAYLTGCVRNAAYQRLGTESRKRAFIRDFLYSDEREVHHHPLTAKMAAAVSQLRSEIRRVIIREIYYHNKSRSEIAQEYKMSRPTIGIHERKALQELAVICKISKQYT